MARSQFIIPVTVFAESQTEANEINSEINLLMKSLKRSELRKISQAVHKNPKLVEKALKFI